MKFLRQTVGAIWKNEAGISLVEALVTLFIFSLISGATHQVIRAGEMTWHVNKVKVELQQELRKSMDWIKQDLQQSGSSTVTNAAADGTAHTSITFRKAVGISGGATSWDANTVTYARTGANILQRTEGASTRNVAIDITSLTFTRQSTTPNIVDVALQAQAKSIQKTLTDSISFKVKMRN